MDNVAIFGSACDPIGSHHEIIVDHIMVNCQMPTWVMPCFHHRFGKNSRLESPQHRWNMVKKLADYRDDEGLIPFDWEIKNKSRGSMFETIARLKREYPAIKFHIAIGMDNANVIENWDRGNFLIQENPFIVFERDGEEAKVDWFKNSPHQLLQLNLGNDFSSTALRNAIASGDYKYAEEHLSKPVWDYIKEHHLYGHRS